MDNPQQGKKEEEASTEEATHKQKAREGNTSTKPPTPTNSPPPSSSSSSSPSHEFSFTISLHPPSTPSPTGLNRCNKSPASFAIDLAPADDIFFHGHLLPLHLLSHPPISPRTSNVSIESFSVPIKTTNNTRDNSNNNNSSSSSTSEMMKERIKSKSFTSLFGGIGKWRKGSEAGEMEEDDKKKKKRFDVFRLLKKYLSVVEPLLFFKGAGKEQSHDMRRRPYSFSGCSNLKGREEWRRRRGELSAPASMRTSPTNSGYLLAATNCSSSDESSMEELQNAIQAAIQHCKNSIAMKEEKFIC